MIESGAPSAATYIQHHLEHLQLNLHTWSLGNGGFWTLNIDTFVVSLITGFLFLGVFFGVAKKFNSNKPTKLQVAVEMLVELVGRLTQDLCHKPGQLVAPFALTIFVWVFLLNVYDLIPVDLIPRMLVILGVIDFRVVATDDPNLTFALSFSVFLLVIFYNFSTKGWRTFTYEIFTHPFGLWLFPVNLVFRIIEEGVKPLSLSLRLFGNMLAGEIVFLLIAVTPWWLQWTCGGVWSLFHIVVIIIQAFVFMMLSLGYVGMAQESKH